MVGTDQNSDLAAIKVNVPAAELHPLALGNSDTLKVGETVAAIGDPRLLTGSMTTGIISAVGRSLPGNVQAVQRQLLYHRRYHPDGCLAQPWQLRRPVLNLNGQVVGVNWAVQVDTTERLSALRDRICHFHQHGQTRHPGADPERQFAYPYLGFSMQDNLPLDVINALGLKSTTGAYVAEVVAGGPADKAGIKPARWQPAIQGLQFRRRPDHCRGWPACAWSMRRPDALSVLNKSPGDTVTLTVLRGNQKVDIKLTLGTRPSS